MTPILQHMTDFFSRQKKSVGVIALSGGPDSVALSFLAKTLNERGVLPQFTLAHLNHQLRGPDSDADEAFVIELADRWRLPVVTERIDIAALAEGRNLEETARAVRYAWLTQMARANGASWVATGHTADDQAETVLHHVLRGSGLSGQSGIAERRPLADEIALVRPLLKCRRDELLAILKSNDIPFRVDTSNEDLRFTRNRLRREIIPLLQREINPALIEVLARLGSQAHECQAAVTVIAGERLAMSERPRTHGVLVFAKAILAAWEPFWVREIFRLVWSREGWPMGEMNANDWRGLESLVDGSLPRHDFPGGVRAKSERHVVQLWHADKP